MQALKKSIMKSLILQTLQKIHYVRASLKNCKVQKFKKLIWVNSLQDLQGLECKVVLEKLNCKFCIVGREKKWEKIPLCTLVFV